MKRTISHRDFGQITKTKHKIMTNKRPAEQRIPEAYNWQCLGEAVLDWLVMEDLSEEVTDISVKTEIKEIFKSSQCLSDLRCDSPADDPAGVLARVYLWQPCCRLTPSYPSQPLAPHAWDSAVFIISLVSLVSRAGPVSTQCPLLCSTY